MTEKLQGYFTTGEFAKLCGVKKQTLFHYDAIGLFSPTIVKENGYRYYSYHQLYTFDIISALKELNMPLKEIKTYLDERTPEKYMQLLNKKMIEVDKEIEKLHKIRQIMQSAVNNTEKALGVDSQKITLKELEKEYLLISSPLNATNSKEFSKFALEYRDFCNRNHLSDNDSIGTMLKTSDIMNSRSNFYSSLYVKTNDKNIPSLSIKPKGLYAIAYHHGGYDTIHETYEKILFYAEENHFQLGPYFYEEYMLDSMAVKNENECITQIMVELQK